MCISLPALGGHAPGSRVPCQAVSSEDRAVPGTGAAQEALAGQTCRQLDGWPRNRERWSERLKGSPCPCDIWVTPSRLGDPFAQGLFRRPLRGLTAHWVPPTFSNKEPKGQRRKHLVQSLTASQRPHWKRPRLPAGSHRLTQPVECVLLRVLLGPQGDATGNRVLFHLKEEASNKRLSFGDITRV